MLLEITWGGVGGVRSQRGLSRGCVSVETSTVMPKQTARPFTQVCDGTWQ